MPEETNVIHAQQPRWLRRLAASRPDHTIARRAARRRPPGPLAVPAISPKSRGAFAVAVGDVQSPYSSRAAAATQPKPALRSRLVGILSGERAAKHLRNRRQALRLDGEVVTNLDAPRQRHPGSETTVY